MTDAEAHEYVKRTEAFLDDFFDLLANAKPANQNAMQLVAIPKTIDSVDYQPRASAQIWTHAPQQ